MQVIRFRPHFSRNTLLLMLLLAVLVGSFIFWKQDLVSTIYFKAQLTSLGLIINGAILTLFGVGVLRIIMIFLSYTREEASVGRFIRNQELDNNETPLRGVPDNSIIARRYHTMEHLHQASTPVVQGALASSLLAAESTRTSLPKFISNILILSGVFGTIISLSIALLGASDLLENAVNVSGMGLVIHGMSTALSTTITAIICYLFFGYFYLKLTDAQTNLVSAIEQVTTTYLMPRFQVQSDTTLYEFTGLVRSLQALVNQMQTSQRAITKVELHLLQKVDEYQENLVQQAESLENVNQLLRRGFRLRDDQ